MCVLSLIFLVKVQEVITMFDYYTQTIMVMLPIEQRA